MRSRCRSRFPSELRQDRPFFGLHVCRWPLQVQVWSMMQLQRVQMQLQVLISRKDDWDWDWD